MPGEAATPDEAASLGKTLTPLGGQVEGGADGAIPAWNGGGVAGIGPQTAPSDVFAQERPLFSISARNLDEHSARLSDGTKVLMRKYPDTFRIDVYPTRRTAIAPQAVYEATLRNATRARLVDSPAGRIPADALGGIPFPLAKSGEEAMWNHRLRWRGHAFQRRFANYLITSGGERVLVDGGTFDVQQPYYDVSTASPSEFEGEYTLLRITSDAPADRKGVGYIERGNFNADKSGAWVYLPGQRRVRKLPNTCCDTPLASSAGFLNTDEPDVWEGRMDRFVWTLLGKTELYVPYNSNLSLRAPVDELIGKAHLNPDHVRWELHRVWVVEAKLADGKRHGMARSRYYLDEDTWTALLGDRWNAEGVLARTLWALPLYLPNVPASTAATSGAHDLLTGTWMAMAVPNARQEPYRVLPAFPKTHFTRDALAGEGVR
jgi:hypothetical protein